jgi:hypothetical protein
MNSNAPLPRQNEISSSPLQGGRNYDIWLNSEAPRAKALGITPKLAQPGVWGSLFKTATQMTALFLTAPISNIQGSGNRPARHLPAISCASGAVRRVASLLAQARRAGTRQIHH